jgi:U3 small nucleolar RNA-associated protein 24
MMKNFDYIYKQGQLKNPPFFVLIDTNFIYFALKNKLDIFESFIECLCGKTIVCVVHCVILELEKLGPKFRLPLKVLRDDRVIKLICNHNLNNNHIYADECILAFLKYNKNFIVATCDKDLKRRIKNTGKAIVISIKKKKFVISN